MTAIFQDGNKIVVRFDIGTRSWFAVAFGPNGKVITSATGLTKQDALRIVESRINNPKG